VVAILALGAGEAVRTVSRKRLDVAVWAAFAGSAVPLLLFASTIRSAKEYSAHFWALPVWSDVFHFYPYLFGYTSDVLLGSIGAALVIALALPRRSASDDNWSPVGGSWITAAVVVLAIAPLSTMILAKFVTHGFNDRYAIVALIGTSILVAYGIYAIGQRRTAVAAAAILICGLCFYVNQWELKLRDRRLLADLKSDLHLLRSTHNEPVAITEIALFHRLSFYSPVSMSRRLSYLADPDSSVEFLHQDTADRGLLALRPWFPLQVVPPSEYASIHHYFLAYGYIGDWSWLTYRLPEMSVETKLLSRHGSRLLFAVKTAPVRANTRNPELTPAQQGLFSKLTNTGRSLCESYFGASHCPNL
jgi:hypothetical protein